ncbi:hypothetical protein [Streptomyces sp. NPDC002328]|uniref:hypothetical protein n=1 Tax=Streptomyces sp. NPDC002328 TaxID=3364642 RepID=UPI003673EAC8
MTTLLFLDVDGPLIPFGGPGPYPVHSPRPSWASRAAPCDVHPLLPRLDPAFGPRLLALGCELVWATTWMEDANDVVALWLGLPELPLLNWPEGPEEPETSAGSGLHWKTRCLVARAAGRPFVWLDDEITEADRAWIAAHHPAPALPHRVDPVRGLTDADFEAVGEWLGGREAAGPSSAAFRRDGRNGLDGLDGVGPLGG